MKNKNIYFVILALVPLFIIGCGVTPIPYSFAENEKENGTAKITFVGTKNKEGVDLHYFEDTELPIPKKGNYWTPVIFPAGRPFLLIVNIYDNFKDKGNEKIFKCPALTAGKDYRLEVEINKASSLFGITIKEREEKLILRDAKTKAVIYEQKL